MGEVNTAEYQALLEIAKDNPVALAVLEIHEPLLMGDEFSAYFCGECQTELADISNEKTQFPCETVEAVIKGLGMYE